MKPGSMNLRELLGDSRLPSVELGGLSEDSRALEPGDAFVAIRGQAVDGHEYAARAARRGAVCVLAERELPGSRVPVVVVDALRERRGALAARFYGHPSRDLRCIGVTGTNGKTSIAHHVADLAGRLGRPAGYLGTLGWGELRCLAPAALTTADAIATQRRLASLREGGCAWACLEASSHALAQGRVDDVRFECAVFSNLTRDHLDYHADSAAYGAAKRRLFEFASVRRAVINVDDAFGRELAASLDGPEILTVGRNRADLSWNRVDCHEAGVSARLSSPWGTAEMRLPVFGEFSLANVAAAIGVLAACGFAFHDLVEWAGTLSAVPGRMEFFREPSLPTVVVDYAHTPDALANALSALASHCRGRLICVIGCGGNRDRGKRPLMARAAAAAADSVWLTSDNPRWEEPAAIVAEMRAGLDGNEAVRDEVDRAAAIAGAIAEAEPGDLVVVAGKGHETSQEIQGCRRPFSDRETVRHALARTRHQLPAADIRAEPSAGSARGYPSQKEPSAGSARGSPSQRALSGEREGAPFAERALSGERKGAPLAERALSGEREGAPFAERALSGEREGAPFAERALSGERKGAPLAERALSGERKGAPLAERALSGERKGAPLAERALSGERKGAPLAERALSGERKGAPLAERALSGEREGVPLAERVSAGERERAPLVDDSVGDGRAPGGRG